MEVSSFFLSPVCVRVCLCLYVLVRPCVCSCVSLCVCVHPRSLLLIRFTSSRCVLPRYIYTHITHIRTYTHAYTHLYTYVYTYMHTHIRTYTHTYTHLYLHTYTHTNVHTYIYSTLGIQPLPSPTRGLLSSDESTRLSSRPNE